MNSETIDQTQFLPRNAPIVNRFRAAKGDIDGHIMDGKVVSASVKDSSILAELITRGFLEEYHKPYGLMIIDLRSGDIRQLRHKSNAIFMTLMSDGGLSSRHAGQMYELIIKPFTLRRYRIIEHACNAEYANDAAAHHIAGIEAYRQCFELLVSLTDSAIEKIKDEIEKGLAND